MRSPSQVVTNNKGQRLDPLARLEFDIGVWRTLTQTGAETGEGEVLNA
jgi:hypothetical protein